MQLGAASHNAPLSFNGIQTDNIDQYWSQKRTQNGNIHSTKLDVYVEKQSTSISYILPQLKQGRKFYAFSSYPLTARQNWYNTRGWQQG